MLLTFFEPENQIFSDSTKKLKVSLLIEEQLSRGIFLCILTILFINI